MLIQVVAYHRGMGWHVKGPATQDWGVVRSWLATCAHDMTLTNWGFIAGESPKELREQFDILQGNGMVWGYSKQAAIFQAERGSTPPVDELGPGGDRDKPYTYHMPHNAARLMELCYHRKEKHHAFH